MRMSHHAGGVSISKQTSRLVQFKTRTAGGRSPMMGRCPKLSMLCETPLMKGPALEVDSSSFVEAYSVIETRPG